LYFVTRYFCFVTGQVWSYRIVYVITDLDKHVWAQSSDLWTIYTLCCCVRASAIRERVDCVSAVSEDSVTLRTLRWGDPGNVDVFAQHSQCCMQNVLPIFYPVPVAHQKSVLR